VTDRRALISALKAVIERRGQDLLTLIDDLYNQGHDLRRFYQDLVLYARHLLLAGLHAEARNLVAVADTEWEDLSRLARQAPAPHLHNLLSVLLHGEEELKRASQPRLALEVLLLKLVDLEPVLPLAAWVNRLEALEQRLEAPRPGAALVLEQPAAKLETTPVPTQAPAPPAAPAETDLEQKWQAFLKYLREAEGGPLYGKLSHSSLVSLLDNKLKVRVGRAWNAAGARHQARLQELVRNFFGPQYTLEMEVQEERSPAKSPAASQKPLDLAKVKQQALEIFGGEFLPSPGKEDEE
jgi:DNA polymerase-3 subunit gamma/tau